MHGIATEVPQEVGVLLQHSDFNSGPGKEQAQHDPSRTSANHNALRAAFHSFSRVSRRR
ncbi:hypothetical protein NtRootA1_48290 [Arthrobacter sp. NtRootA1]|nr:hypothetical protein NtRootA1_48290 [Arthrobacter sp. NtRootA1]